MRHDRVSGYLRPFLTQNDPEAIINSITNPLTTDRLRLRTKATHRTDHILYLVSYPIDQPTAPNPFAQAVQYHQHKHPMSDLDHLTNTPYHVRSTTGGRRQHRERQPRNGPLGFQPRPKFEDIPQQAGKPHACTRSSSVLPRALGQQNRNERYPPPTAVHPLFHG